MRRQRREWFWMGALSVVAFVLAHDLVYLFTYGPTYQAVLARTGHGERWTLTLLTVVALAALLAVVAMRRLLQLNRLAHEIDRGAAQVEAGRPADLARHVARLWPIIFALALLLFAARENVEHISAGLPAPGLSVLGSSAYFGTPFVVGAVALVIAILAGLYRWRADVLVARIAAARARWARPVASPARRNAPWAERLAVSIVGRRLAGRAPPVVSAI